MVNAEQFMSAHKANLEILVGLQGKAFEGIEKLVALNVATAKSAGAEAADAVRAALSVKDAQELVALQAGLLQPVAEKTAAYAREAYEIVVSTYADVAKVVEATTADARAQFMSAVDTAVKNAPAGSENVISLVKSAVAGATNAYDGFQKAAKQAAGVAEANMQTLSAQARASLRFPLRRRSAPPDPATPRGSNGSLRRAVFLCQARSSTTTPDIRRVASWSVGMANWPSDIHHAASGYRALQADRLLPDRAELHSRHPSAAKTFVLSAGVKRNGAPDSAGCQTVPTMRASSGVTTSVTHQRIEGSSCRWRASRPTCSGAR